jgi:hypothetical protein
VLLLEFTSDWVLMVEDEVQLHHRKHCQNEMTSEQRMFYLSARASVVRSEHHNPRGGIREFLPTGLEAILKKFDVTTITVPTLLVLDLI